MLRSFVCARFVAAWCSRLKTLISYRGWLFSLTFASRARIFLHLPHLAPQLRLDVSEFGREASRLGVDVSPFPPYERLLEVVEARDEKVADGASAR